MGWLKSVEIKVEWVGKGEWENGNGRVRGRVVRAGNFFLMVGCDKGR